MQEMRHLHHETIEHTRAEIRPSTARTGIESWIGAVSNHAAKYTLFMEGDPADHVYKVVRGTICLYTLLANGRRQVLRFCRVGDIFGLAPMETYRYSADTLTNASVMRIRRNQLDTKMDANPVVRAAILGSIHDELASMQKHLLLLGRKTAAERVASFLFSMFEHPTYEGNDGQTVELPMTRTDIADYLGITQETVCRVLGQLKRKGVIRITDPHRIELLQGDVLEDAAEDESILAHAA